MNPRRNRLKNPLKKTGIWTYSWNQSGRESKGTRKKFLIYVGVNWMPQKGEGVGRDVKRPMLKQTWGDADQLSFKKSYRGLNPLTEACPRANGEAAEGGKAHPLLKIAFLRALTSLYMDEMASDRF
jgi:hypothetical protein